jgi:hypothetical protein
MALDRIGLRMIASRVKGAAILSLGYPDITASAAEAREILGVEVEKFTDHGLVHKIKHPLPETVDTLTKAGAASIDCVDVKAERGVERIVNLNERQEWPREYDLVINPGTLEHCFDIATAMFNAWRAVKLKGAMLFVGPLSMVNHGFWNICPTMVFDFARENGGLIEICKARDSGWRDIPVNLHGRYTLPPECVLYSLIRKENKVAEKVPVQNRFL